VLHALCSLYQAESGVGLLMTVTRAVTYKLSLQNKHHKLPSKCLNEHIRLNETTEILSIHVV